MTLPTNQAGADFDLTSNPEFFEYYSEKSLSPTTIRRFSGIRDQLIRLLSQTGYRAGALDILDVGCGAGTGTRLWTEIGHRATGVDVNGPLIKLARERAQRDQLDIHFEVSSATTLPFDDASQDVCMMPELLEHVEDWQSCLNEAVRVLRPGGALYLATTNKLNPIQEEFDLPMYSWYPGFLKRRYERLAVTTRPELVNHAKYPALHWFTYFGLNRYLRARGMRCITHFEAIDAQARSAPQRFVLASIRALPPAKWAALIATPATRIYAVKDMKRVAH